jgi:hypothetical protein
MQLKMIYGMKELNMQLLKTMCVTGAERNAPYGQVSTPQAYMNYSCLDTLPDTLPCLTWRPITDFMIVSTRG